MKQLPRQYFDYNCGLLLSLQLQFFALIMVKLMKTIIVNDPNPTHSDWKSRKNWKSEIMFSTQDKIREFANFEKKSWNLLNLAKNLGKFCDFFVKYK